MDCPNPIPVSELATRTGARVLGDSSISATGINEIHKVRPGDICFVDHPKYYNRCLNSAATIIFIDKDVEVPTGKAVLVMNDPFRKYDELVREYRPRRWAFAQIDPSAKIHETATIEPGVVIAHDVEIGAHSVIQSGAYIGEHTIIGEHCLVQPNVVIGSDAFYYKKQSDGHYDKWRSGGRVILHDYTDIGAGCTIQRGVSGDTIIGRGTKLDCLVHIAHGVVLGENCLITAHVAIAGKAVLGDNIVMYGQSGIAPSTHVESNTTILAQAGVTKDIGPGSFLGSPAKPARQQLKDWALIGKIRELRSQIAELQSKIAALQKSE